MIFVKDSVTLKASGQRALKTLKGLGFRVLDEKSGETLKQGFFKKKGWRFCKACSYKITPETAASHPYSGWHAACLPEELKEKMHYRRCKFCLRKILPGEVSSQGSHAECAGRTGVSRTCKTCGKEIKPGTGGSYQYQNWHKACRQRAKGYGQYLEGDTRKYVKGS